MICTQQERSASTVPRPSRPEDEKNEWRSGAAGYLTVGLGLRPLQAPHTLVHGDLLQEGVALRLREVRRLQLAKVELHGAVVADDVGEERLAVQTLLAEAEGLGGLGAVLREGQDHFLALKVLSGRRRERQRLRTETIRFEPAAVVQRCSRTAPYNHAADDVVLFKGLPIVLRHTVGGLLGLSGVGEGQLLLTWTS